MSYTNNCRPNVVLMFGPRRRPWTNINFKQTVGHPYCDYNYATFFVECRLCKYVITQQASIKCDKISLKKVVDH